MAELEKVTQSKVMRAVRLHDGYVYKNAQSAYTEVGRPDLTACVPAKVSKLVEMYGMDGVVGLFVGIEVKRPGRTGQRDGGLSKGQIVVKHQIEQAHGLWFKFDNPSDAERLMKTYKGGDDAVQ